MKEWIITYEPIILLIRHRLDFKEAIEQQTTY